MGVIGKAVWWGTRHLESTRRVKAWNERLERVSVVSRAAHSAAVSELEDEQAKAWLAAQLAERAPSEEALMQALEHAERDRRFGYLADREYRLLAAAIVDANVDPVPVAHQRLFGEEGELGRMPIADAYSRLARLEPGLLDLESHVRSLPAPASADDLQKLPNDVLRERYEIFGRMRESPHEILRTGLASSVASQYLQILRRGVGDAECRESYFESPYKVISAGR